MKKSLLNERSYELASYLYENTSKRIKSPPLFGREWRFLLSNEEINALNETYQKFLFCEPLLEHSSGRVSRIVLWESFLMKELLGPIGAVAKGAWNKVKKAAGWVGSKAEQGLGAAAEKVKGWKKEVIKKMAKKDEDEDGDNSLGHRSGQKKSSKSDDGFPDEKEKELSDDELKEKALEKLKELSPGSHSDEAKKMLPAVIEALKKKNRISYTLSSDYNKNVKIDHPSLEKMLSGLKDKSKIVPMKYAILSLLHLGAVKENQET